MSTIQNSIRRWTTDIGVAEFFSEHSGYFVRIFSILLGVIVWQIYTAGQPPYLFPGLGEIYAVLAEQVTSGNLPSSLLQSLQTLFAGYILAAIVGIAVGLFMGLNEVAETVLDPYVSAFYVAPISAMVPIFILIGGASFSTRVFVVFLFAVFEILVDTYQGVESTPEGALEAARSFGAGKLFILKNVIIPHDLPYIFAGLRLGIGRAVKGMVLSELLVQYTNLGKIIRTWADNFQIAGVLSVVILLMFLGIVLTRIVQVIENHVITWHAEVEI